MPRGLASSIFILPEQEGKPRKLLSHGTINTVKNLAQYNAKGFLPIKSNENSNGLGHLSNNIMNAPNVA